MKSKLKQEYTGWGGAEDKVGARAAVGLLPGCQCMDGLVASKLRLLR